MDKHGCYRRTRHGKLRSFVLLCAGKVDTVNPSVDMRFRMIDRIIQLEPGVQITAIKTLRADEEYLQDHFPRFPVMPGVLMLEAMFQASMWLVRSSDEFAHGVVVLTGVRNVKYADFVVPGQTLTVKATIQEESGSTTKLKSDGSVDGSVAVTGRLILEKFSLADRYPQQGSLEPFARREARAQFERLYQPAEDS